MSALPYVEIVALVAGVAGPIAMLVRDVWKPEYFDFIWKRRTLLVATVSEFLVVVVLVSFTAGIHKLIFVVTNKLTGVSSIYVDAIEVIASASLWVALLGVIVSTLVGFFTWTRRRDEKPVTNHKESDYGA